MVLMSLDSYFHRLSAVSSLWTPLRAAIPVLHWMVSWWILLPGWEPNLVSLVPLSHNLPLFLLTKVVSLSFQLQIKQHHSPETPKSSNSAEVSLDSHLNDGYEHIQSCLVTSRPPQGYLTITGKDFTPPS
ncbi:hypothetical protein DSO57_1001761 [Entomophthora muscae]|uniref:Uncharacterized protein n=1 Tax=Entomophthora muscae TaxID=34485 RepID=A0ACC2T8T5_9FUNG|nr:hypothetical protein DSO57_1001761 [Entomophthora muscae]